MKNLLMGLLLALPTAGITAGFTVSSDDVQGQLSNRHVFKGFGCEGENISPQLSWKNAPKETKSFAVTAYDPDAPTGSGWWHWVMFDIPANVKQLARGAGDLSGKNAPPDAIQSTTSFGQKGFGGACPPSGDKAHQYVFTVHALSIDSLGLDANATPALVGYVLNANSIAKSSVVAYYGR